jgi:hypothetical protein
MHFDLELEIRSNPDFAGKVEGTLHEMMTAYAGSRTDPDQREVYHTQMSQLLELVRYNTVLFTPYAWPAYPKDQPLYYSDYPFAFQMFHMQVGGYKVFKGSRQISKCRSVRASEPISAANGQPLYPMDLRVGQKILSVSDNGRRVADQIVAIHRTGRQPVSRVVLHSGERLLLSQTHQLRLFRKWEQISNLAPGSQVAVLQIGGFFEGLKMPREQILMVATAGDRVPGWVFELSPSDTCLFLGRLWAKHGSVTQKPPRIVCPLPDATSADGVRALLLKFGIRSRITRILGAGFLVRVTESESKVRFLDLYYGSKPEFERLETMTWSKIKSVEPVGEEETWDIETERFHNYILDGVVSHNSTSFACRQMLNARLFRAFRSLYIVPRNDQLTTYQNKFSEIEKACHWWRRNSALRQNLGYKEFPNGSVIEMTYALTSSSGIRGKTTDELLFDEAQHLDPDLEIEIMQTQSASTMPVTIYAGTSLSVDTFLEEKWSNSSLGLWVIRCDCGHFNIPVPEHNVMDMIQPDGPSCVKCHRVLNVKSGRYEHHDKQALDAGREGYHIPQIIVPAVVYNPIRWANIYELKLRSGHSPQFLREILGISTEEGSREITKKQLQAICTLGRNIEKLHAKAMNRQYRWVISGCDWGGSDYNPDLKTKVSTTVHAMIGVTAENVLEIIHFRRYGGMDYDEIIGDILENHTRLNAFAIATDFGVGAVYNSKLRAVIPPERHLIFGYVGPNTNLIKEPEGPHMYNQWSLNKTESISLTYQRVREKGILCYDWDMASHYLADFQNLFRSLGEREAGATTFVYRAHPTKPNDALMAVNYAHMLAKILIGEPMFADLSVAHRLMNVMTSSDFGLHASQFEGAYSG